MSSKPVSAGPLRAPVRTALGPLAVGAAGSPLLLVIAAPAVLCQSPSVRPLVEAILKELLLRHRDTGHVHLNDIAEVIGGRSVSYDEIDSIVAHLEAEGLAVGEPLNGRDIGVMRDVLESARRLRAELRRPPTVEEIALASGHPPHAVRRALEHGKSAASFHG